MSSGKSPPDSVLALPNGGGALSGLGGKFSPDLFTGTVSGSPAAARRAGVSVLPLPLSLPNAQGFRDPSYPERIVSNAVRCLRCRY
jgi:hypothetical protein